MVLKIASRSGQVTDKTSPFQQESLTEKAEMRLKMQYIREWATLAEPVSAKDLHAAAQRLGLKAACIASRPPAYDPKTVHGGIFVPFFTHKHLDSLSRPLSNTPLLPYPSLSLLCTNKDELRSQHKNCLLHRPSCIQCTAKMSELRNNKSTPFF